MSLKGVVGIKLKRFRGNSLQQKIFIYLFVGILVPFIALGFIQSAISANELDKMLTQNTEQILDQVDMMLTFYMSSMESIMGVVEDIPYTSDYIGGNVTGETEERLLGFMGAIENKYPEIAGILITKNNGGYLSNRMIRKSRDDLDKEDWYRRAMDNPESYIFISKPLGRNLESILSYSEDEIMCIVKALKNPLTGRYEGVMLLDFYLSAFDQNIKGSTLGSEGFLYVTDTQGNMIYTPYNDVVYRIDNAFILQNAREKTIFRIRNQLYQVICKRSDSWNVMGVFLVDDVMSSVNRLKYATVALFIATLVLVRIFLWLIDKMMIEPLYELQKLMKSAENGNIDVNFTIKSDDEIGALGNSFNMMIGEIKKLLIIIDEENKLKREAEFQVLQEQVKPHFLYNTLDTINWIAMEHGVTEIVTLVTALTNLFRLSLNKGKEYITLENEIEQVKSYLVIQTIRYEDTFDYSFDIERDVLSCSVLKLILQPLVENSIYHGVKEKDGFGHIEISARKDGEMIVLSVKDDGIGIEPQKVDEINNMFSSGVSTVGYGLHNVNQRLKFAFGAEGGLEIKSVAGHGTKVTVYHPVKHDETEE